jgi:HPt (histidine-containing phosphotransfer) domain-containing protein
MNESGPIDRSALERLEEWGGERLLYEMVRLFLENSPERMGQIRAGMDAQELDDVKRAAHSLKSSAHNVGAVHVARLAKELEGTAAAEDFDGSVELAQELAEAYELACDGLREVQKGAPE